MKILFMNKELILSVIDSNPRVLHLAKQKLPPEELNKEFWFNAVQKQGMILQYFSNAPDYF